MKIDKVHLALLEEERKAEEAKLLQKKREQQQQLHLSKVADLYSQPNSLVESIKRITGKKLNVTDIAVKDIKLGYGEINGIGEQMSFIIPKSNLKVHFAIENAGSPVLYVGIFVPVKHTTEKEIISETDLYVNNYAGKEVEVLAFLIELCRGIKKAKSTKDIFESRKKLNYKYTKYGVVFKKEYSYISDRIDEEIIESRKKEV